MNIQIGNQLRELRRQSGKTQEDLAGALGVTAQAVSRWEVGVCYPDVELIPIIANYFGVSIDRLFGCDFEREKKVNELYARLQSMNRENNGTDGSMDECVALAREALAEFPENEKLMFMLAEILYNAGYVRYGERHIKDSDGFDRFDVTRHREYAEWREAKALYEKLLENPIEPDMRNSVTAALTNLYAVTGETERAASIARTAPEISGCREILGLKAFAGRERAEAYRGVILKFTAVLADLMMNRETAEHASPQKTAKRLEEIISAVNTIAAGDYGEDNSLHALLARVYLFLADRRWNTGDADGAFQALDKAIDEADCCPGSAARLPEDYPWKCVAQNVKERIQDDSRWQKWAETARK